MVAVDGENTVYSGSTTPVNSDLLWIYVWVLLDQRVRRWPNVEAAQYILCCTFGSGPTQHAQCFVHQSEQASSHKQIRL